MDPRRTSKHDSRLLRAAVAFLVLYICVLVVNGPAKPEFFPFFNWSLFSNVPDPQQEDFGIRFISVDGKPLEPPLYLEKSQSLGLPSGSPDAYKAIQNWGKAVVKGQILRAANGRDVVEDRYLANLKRADYELVSRRYDILQRYKCDCFLAETVLEKRSLRS